MNITRFASTTTAAAAADGVFVSPQGVVVIDAADLYTDPKQMVYGVGGALVHAYRSDKIEE